jgi:hypothetical protein
MRKRRRRLVTALGLTVLVASTNAAWGSFTTTKTASGAYGGLALSAPSLTCSGGLLSSITLGLSSVDETADLYAPGTYRIAGYVIERTGANDNNFATLATVGLADTYSDSPGGGLLGTFTYKYRIRSRKGTHPTNPWLSPVSNVVSVTVLSVLFLGVTRTCD